VKFRALFRPLVAAVSLGLLSLTATPLLAQTFPELTGRVVDQANVIPDAQEAAIAQKLAALEQSTGRQLVVATIADLEGRDVSDYAYRLGRTWGIGDKVRNDGVVFLIAPNDKRLNISVGMGLEPVLTDALSGRIIRDIVTPRFRENDFAGGIDAGVNAIAQQLTLSPEEAAARAKAAAAAEKDRAQSGNMGGLFFIGFIIVIFFVIPALVARKSGKKHKRKQPWGQSRRDDDDDDRGGGMGMPIIIFPSGGFGGGGGGGGGGFDLGGLGGFLGGGGSFGGGGASGGW
jgi:uncharacterized protein